MSMCGIFGMAGFSDKPLLRKMGNLMRYRGPDDRGYFTDSGVGMGMRRLSIIDVKGGRQPVHNEDRDVHAVFNGEIYNYRELRKELSGKHKFYTNSDTETIVHAYEEYGLDFAGKLNGMFGIALWDGRKKTLVLARDRIGKKPLYYTFLGKKILFSSEIKALLLHEGVRRKVNRRVMGHYLSLRYCPGNETIFEGIYKLLPGHLLVYRSGNATVRKYWGIGFADEKHMSEKFYVETLRSLLLDSVKARMISEVPLGVYLSGGLDSTTIVSLMRDAGIDEINTFSIGFGLESDETSFARLAAGYYRTNHREFVVEGANVQKLLPKIVWHLDEPLADITNIPTYLISQLAGKYVTVVLTGEGSDELFSGYAHEKGMIKMENMRRMLSLSRKFVPSVIRHTPLPLLNKFFEYPASMGEKGRERMSELMRNIGNNPGMYALLVSAFDEGEKRALCRKQCGGKTEALFRPFFAADTNLSNRMLLIDANIWLPNYILLRLDRMTMANSLEGRAPFLDYRLLELSSRLPQDMKLRGNTEKYILRRALQGRLPPQIAKRKKRTFITPMHMWGEKQLLDMSSILHESEFFRKPFVEKVIEDYRNSKLIRERQLWTLITFELWHRTFIENNGLKPLNNP